MTAIQKKSWKSREHICQIISGIYSFSPEINQMSIHVKQSCFQIFIKSKIFHLLEGQHSMAQATETSGVHWEQLPDSRNWEAKKERHSVGLNPNKEELVIDVKAGGSLGCSDHEMVEFRLLIRESRAKSRGTPPDFRSTDFNLFGFLLGRIPWCIVLERRRIQKSWLTLSDNLITSWSSRQAILTSRK